MIRLLVSRIAITVAYIVFGSMIMTTALDFFGQRAFEVTVWLVAWFGYPFLIQGVWGSPPVRSFWNPRKDIDPDDDPR